METESPTIQKARQLNKKLQDLMDEPPFKPMNKYDDVTGIIIMRFKGTTETATNCLGQVDFVNAIESLMSAWKEIEQEHSKENPKLAT